MEKEEATIFKGKIDKNFKQWLDKLFGFYADGFLIGNIYDSNIYYQYDADLNALVSSYDRNYLKYVNNYTIKVESNAITIDLKDDDTEWYSYTCAWVNLKPSKTLIFNLKNDQ